MKDLLWPLVEKYGISIAVLVGIILWLTVSVNADLDAIKSHLGLVQREHYEMRFFLRGICLNAADTDGERANCTPPLDFYAQDHR